MTWLSTPSLSRWPKRVCSTTLIRCLKIREYFYYSSSVLSRLKTCCRVSTILILRFTLQLGKRHSPSSIALSIRAKNGKLGPVLTFIRYIDAQIMEDFGEPCFLSCGSEGQRAEEDVSGGDNGRSTPCITIEEYPWAVNMIKGTESGTDPCIN